MSSLNEITKLLEKSSLLNKREILIYKVCIGQRLLNPSQISRLTGIKRTTVYLILDELKKKGLLLEKIKGKRKNISIAPPEALRHLINQEQERIKEKSDMISVVIPLLENFKKIEGEETEIEVFDGKNGVTILLEKILQQKENIYWLGSLDTILEIIEEEKLYRLFTWKRMDTKTISYAISDRRILNNKKFGEKIEGFRQFRFLPDNFEMPALVVLFGSSVGFIRINDKELKIILIKDKTTYKIIEFMFDALWKSLPLC